MGTDVNSTPATPAGPLTAVTPGVAAARRRDEHRVPDVCPTAPPDHGAVTAGAGRRGRTSPADDEGGGAGLSAVCRNAVVLTRGPGATRAVRAWAGSDADEHAVEAVVARLGASLGPRGVLVRTGSGRGCRQAAG
jgi:uroporphyrinogen-III synthase